MSLTVRIILICAVLGLVGGALFTLLGLPFWYVMLMLPMVAVVMMLRASLANNRPETRLSPADGAAALVAPPAPGQARLILFRDGVVAHKLGVDVLIDDAPVAQLRSPRATALDVAAGRHRITLGLSATAARSARLEPLTVDLTSGETCVVKIRVDMGLAKNSFTMAALPIDAALRSRLAAMPILGAAPPA